VSQDEHALAPELVRFVGDPVAAVAALDEETAADACAAIDVLYEELPSIASIDDALANREPQLHDYADDGNVHKVISLDFGGVDAAMATAEHVREDIFF